MDDQQQLTKGQQAVLKAQELVDDMRDDLETFEQRMTVLDTSINQGLDALEKDVAVAEQNLEQIDAETIEKIDTIILDSLQGEDGEGDDEEGKEHSIA